jgi:hypothetical protein
LNEEEEEEEKEMGLSQDHGANKGNTFTTRL